MPILSTSRVAPYLLIFVLIWSPSRLEAQDLFRDEVAPLLSSRCLQCHNQHERQGGFSLQTAATAFAGGESGEAIVAGDPDASYLLDLITEAEGEAEMPKDAPALTALEVALVSRWIAAGAKWPEGFEIEEPRINDVDWWSLKPLTRPVPPELNQEKSSWVRTPVDAFIAAQHEAQGLTAAPEADRRTLLRRLFYDLIGLPPTSDQVDQFVADISPRAYEKRVDELLASPQYGERWARHWLDVVHYGETHGYDKDKLRSNAWPYRDYVIRALNQDKPYGRFVLEQLAGDVLFPDTRDGIVATGFLAAGPWDFVGHTEVPESKIDGKVTRHLDRDDLVATTMNTFVSMTAQCAQCHNHKFDPVTQEDYYSLQAVFAALDRADRHFDADRATTRKRKRLVAEKAELEKEEAALAKIVQNLGGSPLQKIEEEIDKLNKERLDVSSGKAYGYHSSIMNSPDHVKWVQIDLGRPTDIRRIEYVGCWDAFNKIFHGFSFPVRYKIEISNDPEFKKKTVVVDHTAEDVVNPGTDIQSTEVEASAARYVRITATKLALRQNDYAFALGELIVLDAKGVNVALKKPVSSLDSIEAPSRWARQNLVDGYYYGIEKSALKTRVDFLKQRRRKIVEALLTEELRSKRKNNLAALTRVADELKGLPPLQVIYAGMVYHGSGNFRGTGHAEGRPREIRVLHRGNIQKPGNLAVPGTVSIIPDAAPRFELPLNHSEGDRRAALAHWIARRDNPLTWRSIVNRVWLYHFGQGLVDTPNDFGRMGQTPSHPELLDWLAIEFRDNGQSLKSLHRLIVTSAVYRQGSTGHVANKKIDAGNKTLWRMNRRKLEAEAIRDTVLQVAGKLDLRMGGPSFRDFVVEKPEHSPHFQYHKYDPNNPKSHRRAIYRFVVRSQPQPFMDALDCADPSLLVDKRNQTLTALQALALMNNRFMLCMSEHFAARLEREAGSVPEQINLAFRLAFARQATLEERETLGAYATEYGLAGACRLILNLNEFSFVD